MWLVIFMVLHLIVLPKSISCQPVTDSIRGTRQADYKECCPCSDDGTKFREPEMSANSPMGSFTQEDDCPCRTSGMDSQGSPSIFRPFILRNSHPTEKEQQKNKPLLQPEVGLASSVLETIQKATDEEYQEALKRDASRSIIEIKPGYLDSEAGNSRNSLTIILNPGEDMNDGDTAPEASHVHETRCIHSPLGRSSLDNVPRTSKYRLLLKQKPIGPLPKLIDMDNSASNVKEKYDINHNDLITKLRINPLLNNPLITTGGDVLNDPISKANSRYELRTILPDHCIRFKSNELNDNPNLRLTALKSRLRDLVEMRNDRKLNNVPIVKQNNLDINNKGDIPKLSALDLSSPLDTIFDRAGPNLKNIMKLKDVELLPTKFGNDLTDSKFKLLDLNYAATENDVKLLNIDEDQNENKDYEEDRKNQRDSQEEEEDRMDLEKQSNHENSKDRLIEEMQRRLDDCLRTASEARELTNKSNQRETTRSFEYDSKEEESDMEDSVAETSDVEEQISHEEVDSKEDSSTRQNTVENNNPRDTLTEQDSNGLATFKNDILRKLENIKKSIKSKLQDSETITNSVNEKTTISQDLNDSNLNSETDQNMAASLIPQTNNEKDITSQNLLNLSDPFLKPENKYKSNKIHPQDTEDEIKHEEDYKLLIDSTNEDRSVSSEVEPTDTEINEEETSSEDEDPISNGPEIPKFAQINENIRPKDSNIDEMSSQASNSKYNTIVSQLNDNLQSPLQDTFNLFKTPLQIPSLEEIRQGITDIIDAGQNEDFQTEIDPINESSNRNSILSNPLQLDLPKSNNLRNHLTDRYLRPFQNARSNIEGYKSLLDTASIKPIKQPFAYPSALCYPSSLASDKPSLNLMGLSDPIRIPTPDHITSLFNQNNMRSANDPKINLPKTSIINSQKTNSLSDDLKYKLNTLKSDLKHTNHGNTLLGKPRLQTNDFLHTMSRKHEDMKEKLQTLHLDFNDRLASIHRRLCDQKKLEAVNTPTFQAKDNLALPKTVPKKQTISQNLNSNSLADNSLSKTSLKKMSTAKIDSVPLKIPLTNNNFYKMKSNTEPLKGKENIYLNKYPNFSEKHKLNMRKQKTLSPKSKVKISFTTSKPILNSAPKQTSQPIKTPSRLQKEKTADVSSNLKDVSKALRNRFQSLSDSNHAPSELIATKQLNNDFNTGLISANQSRVNYNQADSNIEPNFKEGQQTSVNSGPKNMENPLISNLKELLKARLNKHYQYKCL